MSVLTQSLLTVIAIVTLLGAIGVGIVGAVKIVDQLEYGDGSDHPEWTIRAMKYGAASVALLFMAILCFAMLPPDPCPCRPEAAVVPVPYVVPR